MSRRLTTATEIAAVLLTHPSTHKPILCWKNILTSAPQKMFDFTRTMQLPNHLPDGFHFGIIGAASKLGSLTTILQPLQSYTICAFNEKLPLLVHPQITESSNKRGLTRMLNTDTTSWGRKVRLTLSTFHPLFLGSIRSDTISASLWGLLGLATLKELGLGSHQSS